MPKISNEEKAFLEEIASRPDDDSAKLIFADWLTERGDEWGDFIRLSFEFDSKSEFDADYDQVHDQWLAKCGPMCQRFNEWINQKGIIVNPGGVERGIPISIWAEKGSDFPNAAAQIFDALPTIQAVNLGEIKVAVKDFVECESLSRLHEIDFGYDLKLSPAKFAELISSKHLSNLKSLKSAIPIGDAGAMAIAKNKQLSNLKKLSCDWAGIDMEGLAALVDSPIFSLTSLELNYNDVDFEAEGSAILARAKWPLVNLSLSMVKIRDEGAQILADSNVLDHVETLVFDYGDIQADGAIAIGKSQHLTKLKSLKMTGNGFGDRGAIGLAQGSFMKQLEVAAVGGCEWGAEGLKAILSSLDFGQIKELDVSSDPLSDSQVGSIHDAIDTPGIRTLWLTRSDVGPAGIELLASNSNLSELNTLYLDGNPIERAGAKALAESPHLSSITYLSVSENLLEPVDIELLRDRFGDALSVDEEDEDDFDFDEDEFDEEWE